MLEFPISMRSIKINKTIETISLKDGADMVLRVLVRPKGKSLKEWKGEIERDLIIGKKFFTIRELKLSERA